MRNIKELKHMRKRISALMGWKNRKKQFDDEWNKLFWMGIAIDYCLGQDMEVYPLIDKEG